MTHVAENGVFHPESSLVLAQKGSKLGEEVGAPHSGSGTKKEMSVSFNSGGTRGTGRGVTEALAMKTALGRKPSVSPSTCEALLGRAQTTKSTAENLPGNVVKQGWGPTPSGTDVGPEWGDEERVTKCVWKVASHGTGRQM